MNAKVSFEGDLLEILRQFRFNPDNIADVLNKIADLSEGQYLHFNVLYSNIHCEIRKV